MVLVKKIILKVPKIVHLNMYSRFWSLGAARNFVTQALNLTRHVRVHCISLPGVGGHENASYDRFCRCRLPVNGMRIWSAGAIPSTSQDTKHPI